jgi:hypothetical protein
MLAVLFPTADEVNPEASPQAMAAPMVKLVLQMSKKMFLTASILMRAVVLGTAGIAKASVPSLAVLSANTNGKVCPPSVLNEIFTLLQLIGARLVLFTLQVIVWVEPPA